MMMIEELTQIQIQVPLHAGAMAAGDLMFLSSLLLLSSLNPERSSSVTLDALMFILEVDIQIQCMTQASRNYFTKKIRTKIQRMLSRCSVC